MRRKKNISLYLDEKIIDILDADEALNRSQKATEIILGRLKSLKSIR